MDSTDRYKNRGFTLIELLVVITIIGTLASVVLASLNTARAKARDTQRRSDIAQIALALQLYWTDHDGTYPPHDTGFMVTTSLTELTSGNYMPKLPIDPTLTGLQGYRYARESSGKAYTLMTRLETDSTTNWCGHSVNGGLPAWTGASYYSEITSPSCQ